MQSSCRSAADVPPLLIRSALQFARPSPRSSGAAVAKFNAPADLHGKTRQLAPPRTWSPRHAVVLQTTAPAASTAGPQQAPLLPAADELEQSHLPAGDELAAAQIPPAAPVVPALGGVTPAARAVWRRTVEELEMAHAAPPAAVIVTDDPGLVTRLPPIAQLAATRRGTPRTARSGHSTLSSSRGPAAARPCAPPTPIAARALALRVPAPILALTTSERTLAGAVAAAVLHPQCRVVGSAAGAGGGAAAALLRRRVQFDREVAAAESGMVDAFTAKGGAVEPPSVSEISLADALDDPPTTGDADEVFTTTTGVASSGKSEMRSTGAADWFWGRRTDQLELSTVSLDTGPSAGSAGFHGAVAVSGRRSDAHRPATQKQSQTRRVFQEPRAPIGLDGHDMALVVDPLLTAPWVVNPHDVADRSPRAAAGNPRALPFSPRPPPPPIACPQQGRARVVSAIPRGAASTSGVLV